MKSAILGVLCVALLAASQAGAEEKCELLRIGELPVTMSGTRPLISGTINGKPARFLADSGAFYSMLTGESAARNQLSTRAAPANFVLRGVGGEERVRVAQVADFSLVGYLGGRSMGKAEFMVGATKFGGQIDGIIGQNIIGTADTEFDLANGFIRIFAPRNCKGANFAYWERDPAKISELKFEKRTQLASQLIVKGKINGKSIKVILDTGASGSVLTLKAARRAGIEPEGENVSAAGVSRGIGKKAIESSVALFDSLELGGEVIKNARLRIGGISGEIADMLLGADFFLSHRVYVDTKANRVYFTYNGGPVFDLTSPGETPEERTPSEAQTAESAPPVIPVSADVDAGAAAAAPVDAASGAPAPSAAIEPPPTGTSPEEAANLRRRGAASAGRRDFSAAMVDLDRAVQLDSADPENYYQRALVYVQTNRVPLGLADLDRALQLKPDHQQALMERGAARLRVDDEKGASEDFAAAQRLAPENAQLPLDAARALGAAGKTGAAIAQLDAWLERYPKDERLPDALLIRCRLRAAANIDLDQALADCKAAFKKGARSSIAYNTRGLVQLRRGDYDEAIDDYDDALDRQPKDASSLYGRGLAKLRQGETEEGKQDIAAAATLDPKVVERYAKLGLMP